MGLVVSMIQHMFWVGSVLCRRQPLTTAGEELDYLGNDLSDLSEAWQLVLVQSLNSLPEYSGSTQL